MVDLPSWHLASIEAEIWPYNNIQFILVQVHRTLVYVVYVSIVESVDSNVGIARTCNI